MKQTDPDTTALSTANDIKIGDEAFDPARMYARLQPLVRGAVRQVLGTTDELDDITHEVFLRIWKAMQSGGGPQTSESAYAWQVARNTAISHLRQVTRSRVRDTRYAQMSEVELSGRGSDNDVIVRTEVIGLLAELPESTRDLMWAADVEHRDLASLADEHHTTPGALAAHLYRARKACRASLAAAG